MVILVLEDVNETRDGIEKLLKADGYRVALARDEKEAIESVQRQRPDLILMSVAGLPHEVVAADRHRPGRADGRPIARRMAASEGEAPYPESCAVSRDRPLEDTAAASEFCRGFRTRGGVGTRQGSLGLTRYNSCPFSLVPLQ